MDNITAKVSCFVRAYHYRNDPAPVFADAVASLLLGAEYDQIAQSLAQGIDFFLPDFHGSPEEGLRLIVERQLAPSVLGRSAYCESLLAREQRLGCGQYVIFASGYDTFAIRNSDAAPRVFELDLPELLAEKLEKTEKAGLRTQAVCVPCGLTDDAWPDKLTASGFDPAVKAFAGLLGISYYLDKPEFRRLLKNLSGIFCAGSSVCFDYPSADDSPESLTNRALAAGAGERMKASYTAPELEDLLAEVGFLVYEQLEPEEMTGRFFVGHNRRCPSRLMTAPRGVCYVHAVRTR